MIPVMSHVPNPGLGWRTAIHVRRSVEKQTRTTALARGPWNLCSHSWRFPDGSGQSHGMVVISSLTAVHTW